jgi:hypothetical protein
MTIPLPYPSDFESETDPVSGSIFDQDVEKIEGYIAKVVTINRLH